MRGQTVILGCVLGLVLAAGVLGLVQPGGGRRVGPAPGPVLSDCDGAIGELVIQYAAAAAEIVAPVYREFLPNLPADVTVHVVCPDQAAFADLADRVGSVACRLRPIAVGHAMSAWSRDRWLALRPPAGGGPVTLLHPREEAGAAAWPRRAGDGRIADDLAAALGEAVAARRCSLLFDGGDFVADERRVFVTPRVTRRNVQHTVTGRTELLAGLRAALGRQIVLLADSPDHHAGMFMMPAGGNVVLVGSPALAAKIRDESGSGDGGGSRNGDKHLRSAAEPVPVSGADFSAATQRRFDAVAERCAEAGCRVVRIPVVPGRDGRSYLTYLNVILDQRDGRRIVYMPVFGGVEALNESGAAVWRSLGYEVCPVDCTSAYAYGGSLRCLVSVLRRG